MNRAKWGIYTLMIFAALLISGCTHTYTPSSGYSSVNIIQFHGDENVITGGGGGAYNLHAEQWIASSTGGNVDLTFRFGPYSMGNSISVPAGALPADTLISITVPNAYVCEFYYEPSGIFFNTPVLVSLSYHSPMINPESEDWEDLHVFWFNEETEEWEEIPSDISISRHELDVTFQLEHFSRYAVGRP